MGMKKVLLILAGIVFSLGCVQVGSYVLAKTQVSGILQTKNADSSTVKNDLKQDGNNTVKRDTKQKTADHSITDDNLLKVIVEKKNTDTKGVTLSKGFEEYIGKKEGKNKDKIILKIKQTIAELGVTDEYRKGIENRIIKGNAVNDVLTAYEFLYDNLGKLNELDKLIKSKAAGKNWADVFKEYTSSFKKYEPKNFPVGYLENLFKNPELSPDDVTIADTISQKEYGEYYSLIAKRIDGQSWKEIKTVLGIINLSQKVSRVGITSVLVDKNVKRTGLSSDKVMEALIIAGQKGLDPDASVDMIKSGKKKEDLYAEAYSKKFS